MNRAIDDLSDDDSVLSLQTKAKLNEFRRRFSDEPFCSTLERLFLAKHGKTVYLKDAPVGCPNIHFNFGDNEHQSMGTRLHESDYSRVIESFKAVKNISVDDVNFIAKELSFIPIDEALRMKEFLDYLPATPLHIKMYVNDRNKRIAAKSKPAIHYRDLEVDEETKFPYNYYVVLTIKGHARIVRFNSQQERANFYRLEGNRQMVNLAELIKLTIKKKSVRCRIVEEQKITRLTEATKQLNQIREQKKQLEALHAAKNMNQAEILEQLEFQNIEIIGAKKKIKELHDRVILLEHDRTKLRETCEENADFRKQIKSMKKQIERIAEENMVLKENNKQFEERIEEISEFLRRDSAFRKYMEHIQIREEALKKINEFESEVNEGLPHVEKNQHQQDNIAKTQNSKVSILRTSAKRYQTPSVKTVSFS